jgi:outer membrane lipase/esterase
MLCNRAQVVPLPRRLAMLGCAAVLLAHCLMVMGQAAPTPPTVSGITFAPAAINSGGTSQMSIAFGNANGVAATLTQTLTDTLPSGMTVANGGAAGTCTTGAVGAAAGSGTITYAAGATIPAGGCAITVNVTARSATAKTDYTNTIPAGALQTSLGTNPSGASGTLTVQATVVVPNVVGMSQAAAANALQSAGLIVGTVGHAPATNVPYNAVFSQNPAAGSAIASGSAVAINLSTGAGNATNPNSPLTSVPNFVNPAQLSIAAALERVCNELQTPGLTLTVQEQNLLANCLAIIGTHGGGVDPSGLQDTLSAISGKQSIAQQRTGVQFSGTQFTNIGARLAQLRQGVGGLSFAGLDLGMPTANGVGELLAMLGDMTGFHGLSGLTRLVGGSGGEDSSAVIPSRWGFFINGSLRRGSQDASIYENGFDFRNNGFTAGADYRLRDNLVLGLAYGHSNGNTTFTDGTGRLDSRGNSVSLYGTYYADALYVDAIGTFGHISYDAARTTSFSIDPDSTSIPTNCVAGQCSVDMAGSTSARQLALGTNVGYGFHYRGLTFGPDAAIDYTRIDVNGFTEEDPSQSGMALAFANQTGESLLLKAGGHLSYVLNTRFAVFLPEARAHFVHELKDDQRAVTVHFVDDPSAGTSTDPISNFVIFTDRPARSYFDWAAGFSAQFPYGISAFIDYNSVAAESNIRTHELAFGVRLQHLVN